MSQGISLLWAETTGNPAMAAARAHTGNHRCSGSHRLLCVFALCFSPHWAIANEWLITPLDDHALAFAYCLQGLLRQVISEPLSSLLPTEAGFAVTAISRTPGVTYNESFDLQCIIKPHYPSWVPVSVTWRFQPAGSTEFHDLVTFTRDGGVQWGGRAAAFRTRTAIEKAESSNNVRLSISRASDTEAGKYQCVAELWRKNYNSSWTRLADRTSNLLEIRVLRPGECPGVCLGGWGMC